MRVAVGLPMKKGRMLMLGIIGEPGNSGRRPCAPVVVPCGMEAMRTTVAVSAGLVVGGTAAHMPGSI